MSFVDYVGYFLRDQYTTLILVLLFCIRLYNQKSSRDAELRYFWTTVICCFLLTLQDMGETLASQDPDLRLLRISFSILGYTLRPVAAVGLLLVVCPPERRSWRIWIPCLINLAVNLTAYFSPLAFSFDEEYAFVRGPLGYVVFIIGFLYIFQLLAAVWRYFYDRAGYERVILIACAFSCIFASVVDALFGGCHLTEAILVSSVFFFFFLRSHDNRLDPLTRLENRFAFYADVKHRVKDVSAVASLDMNGLKRINDTLGHAEGDRALAEIGRCLGRVNKRNTAAYRIGGDEFVVLFLQQDEELVKNTIEQIKRDVAAAGYSISAGYVMKTDDESVDSALQRSDHAMYGDKSAYYQNSGADRRSRRR